MEDLVGRYHDAVTRYIHLKVRDKHLADEVLQEFWTKLLTGKLAGADKSKGRFRDYLRTVLHRLIIDHFRTRKLQPLPPGDLLDPSRPDADFDRVWREAVHQPGLVSAGNLPGLDTQESLRHRLATAARLSQGLDRRDRRQARRNHPHPGDSRGVSQESSARSREIHRACWSRSCEKPSTPPAPKRSRRRSTTWAGPPLSPLHHVPRRLTRRGRSQPRSPRASSPICLNSFGFELSAADENSPVPLTLSFQHVQFNKGGVRNAKLKAWCA